VEPILMQSNGIEALPQFLTSLAIGLLIGLERERNPSPKPGCVPSRWFHCSAPSSRFCRQGRGTLVAGCRIIAVAGMIIAAYINTPTRITIRHNHCHRPADCYALGVLVWFGYSKLAVMLPSPPRPCSISNPSCKA